MTAGAHDITGTDPAGSGSLKYIVRVESGSPLAGAGQGGADIGADIKNIVGASGSLWGDTGYNADTGVPMWPFPNEALIRSKMAAYNGYSINGARGFCAGTTTLTQYIWQYLGNNIPAQIYTLNAPSNLSATALADGSILVDWTVNSNFADGYEVDRKIGAGGTYGLLTTLGPNTTFYNDKGLSAGTIYFYRVMAYVGSQNSAYSNEASATAAGQTGVIVVAAPSNLTATALQDGSISLAWVDNSNCETGIRLERKFGPSGAYLQIASLGPNAKSYIDKSVTPGMTYFYRVIACDANTLSCYSNEACVSVYAKSELNSDSLAIPGEILVLGSTKNRGVINPDQGDTAKIYFKGSGVGRFDCMIYSLNGELIWQQSEDNVNEGKFEWTPRGMASGCYIAYVKGPGLSSKKKVEVIR